MTDGSWEALPIGYGSTHPRTPTRLFDTEAGVAVIGAGPESMFGAVLDVDAGRWRSSVNAPVNWRDQYGAASTGSEILIWGGADTSGALADGAAFAPATNEWRQIADSPLAGRCATAMVWTGSEVLVVGGGTEEGVLFNDAAMYDPATDSWRSITPLPGGERFSASAVWTGSEAIIWGGVLFTSYAGDGAAYDPQLDTWRTLAAGPLEARTDHSAIWTGQEMIVWGGTRWAVEGAAVEDGAAYDPTDDAWRSLASAPIGARYGHSAVWAGDRMVVWGGSDVPMRGPVPPLLEDGATYDPATDNWTTLSSSPLAPRFQHDAVWTGDQMLVWGGCCVTPTGESLKDGAVLRLG